ncbi:hypothetical protein niasHT_030687 [Heterodera trifolii]|uniref:Uncharacterized protein n=1 Tax=Heterodera trifolii TaxID=157864 RepID=A0ABD2HTW5_9BILA
MRESVTTYAVGEQHFRAWIPSNERHREPFSFLVGLVNAALYLIDLSEDNGEDRGVLISLRAGGGVNKDAIRTHFHSVEFAAWFAQQFHCQFSFYDMTVPAEIEWHLALLTFNSLNEFTVHFRKAMKYCFGVLTNIEEGTDPGDVNANSDSSATTTTE